jgi:Flp pilus assembly protein TadD
MQAGNGLRSGCVHLQVMHAENEKEAGNDAFEAGNFDKAVAAYTRALELQPTDATLYSNRAAAYLGMRW